MARLGEWWAIGLIPCLAAAVAFRVSGPVWVFLAAIPSGFVLQQLARFYLEVLERAFDAPTRPALVLLQTRLGEEFARSGYSPYQVYEVALYRHHEWQAARDHIHRCWQWLVNLRAAAFALATAGALLAWSATQTQAALRVGAARPSLLLVFAVGGFAAGILLWRKAEHTKELLHAFDCAWVAAHWAQYAAVAQSLMSTAPEQPA